MLPRAWETRAPSGGKILLSGKLGVGLDKSSGVGCGCGGGLTGGTATWSVLLVVVAVVMGEE